MFANRLQAAIVSEHLDAFPDPVRASPVLPFGNNELSAMGFATACFIEMETKV
jgi:hypothetical protein